MPQLAIQTGRSKKTGKNEYHAYDMDQMPLEWRRSNLRKYGGETLSYSSTYQAGLRHFGNESGFLAFARKWGYTFVLGDPICRPSDNSELISQFLAKFRRAAFCQIGDDTAAELDRRGFWVNPDGD